MTACGGREGLLENEEVYGIFGMHPHNAKYYNAATEEKIIACLQHPKAGTA
jgi:TatD DNase family protein